MVYHRQAIYLRHNLSDLSWIFLEAPGGDAGDGYDEDGHASVLATKL